MQAKDIMTAPVVTITPYTPVHEVAALLRDRRIGGVPVLEGGQVVGLVSEGDLLHRHEIGTDHLVTRRPWWTRLFKADRLPADYVKSHGGRARDIMTRQVISVSEDTPVDRLAELFEVRRIGRVPVLRGHRLIGIVCRADLVEAIARQPTSDEAPGVQTDEAIRARLLAELQQQPWWRSNWSNVFVTDGVVSYRGLVEGEDQRRAARVAAENVPGVRRVEDDRVQTAAWQPMM